MSQELKDVKVILAGLRSIANTTRKNKAAKTFAGLKENGGALATKKKIAKLTANQRALELLASYRYNHSTSFDTLSLDLYEFELSQHYRNVYLQSVVPNKRFIELYLTPRSISLVPESESKGKVLYKLKDGTIVDATHEALIYSLADICQSRTRLYNKAIKDWSLVYPELKGRTRELQLCAYTDMYAAGYVNPHHFESFLEKNAIKMPLQEYINYFYSNSRDHFIKSGFTDTSSIHEGLSRDDKTSDFDVPAFDSSHVEYDPSEDDYDL